MTYAQEMKQLFDRLSLKDFRCDLEPMREACHLLSNPQEAYASVHIVGTNGKGSTAAFLNSLLTAAGYQVGLITSPHLIDLRERIQINRENISWEALSELVLEIASLLPDREYLSFFEMMTLAGFHYFAKMEVDVAIVEAGMGGRLDATNVLKPQVVLFTPIALDHQTYLGDSVAKITQEKCGVLKPEMTVISAPQPADAAIVIDESCKKLGLELKWADPEAISIPLGLPGKHQRVNAACALLAAKAILDEEILDRIYAAALLKTKWPGRLEYLRENPKVLVDGAHNTAGIQALAEFLKEAHPDMAIHFVVGVLKDKNWETMFAPLAPLAADFICVAPKTERALPTADLAACLRSFGKPVREENRPMTFALQEILANLNPQDLLVVTGSLYVVGEILKDIKN